METESNGGTFIATDQNGKEVVILITIRYEQRTLYGKFLEIVPVSYSLQTLEGGRSVNRVVKGSYTVPSMGLYLTSDAAMAP